MIWLGLLVYVVGLVIIAVAGLIVCWVLLCFG